MDTQKKEYKASTTVKKGVTGAVQSGLGCRA